MSIDPRSLRSRTVVLRKTPRVRMKLAVLWMDGSALPDAFTVSSLSLYHKRQVHVHSSLAFTRNIQPCCNCLQGAQAQEKRQWS